MNSDRRMRLEALEEALGYRFNDPSLLDCALTHRSYANENPDLLKQDNERLEFLGDAVLTLCISDMLMKKFPDCTEGDLSKIRSSIVNEKPLARLAKELHLGDYLLLGRGEDISGGRLKHSLLANAFEAIIAAIYCDTGFDGVCAFVGRRFLRLLDTGDIKVLYQDYKTSLQEITQNRFRIIPRYSVLREFGPDHDKVFQIRVSVGDIVSTAGLGRNKKEAEQRAAKKALEAIENLRPPDNGEDVQE
ncbi:MAG: ribonuclease III [Syntrophales bacterium]|jgi:ribonuclease III|nr:ribonuclease III [Syntrophales bacterium]